MFARVGRNAADELRLTGRQFVAIDLEQAKFNEHHERFPELLFLDGDASDDAVLLAADIEDAAGRTVDSLRDLILTRGVSTVDTTRSLDEIVMEHQAILAGLESGDGDSAARMMKEHLVNTSALLLEQEGGRDSALSLGWEGLVVGK